MVEASLADVALIRLPLEHVRDEHDKNLVESFASACNLVFVDMDSASTNEALPVIVRSGTSAVVHLPFGLSLKELLQLRKLCEEAGSQIGVSRPMRFRPAIRSLADCGRVDFVWAEMFAPAQASKVGLITELVDVIVELIGGKSIQRVDSKSSSPVNGGGETLGISIRFQNSAMAMVRISFCEDGSRPSSTLRVSGSHVSGSNGEATAVMNLWTPDDSGISAETASFTAEFFGDSVPSSTLVDAVEVTRIVEQIMARFRQHDSLAI